MPNYTHQNYKGAIHYYAMMYIQIAPYTERLVKHFKIIRMLTTMYAMMCIQTAFITEGLITHLTSIRVLTIMCA
jgi:hypothetical protein